MNAKYIKTEDNQIIVFPKDIPHSTFQHLNPKSAGFIQFGIAYPDYNNPEITVSCRGKSDTLNLAADTEDSNLAMHQLVTYHLFA